MSCWERQQTFLQRGDGHAVGGVRVHNAIHVVAGGVDGRVDDVAREVDAGFAGVDHLAAKVDLHEIGGRNLIVTEAELVDEELIVRSGDARGDVVVDERRHAEVVGQAVGGGQVDARPPFSLGDGSRVGGAHHRLLASIIRCPLPNPPPWGEGEICSPPPGEMPRRGREGASLLTASTACWASAPPGRRPRRRRRARRRNTPTRLSSPTRPS